MFARAEGFRLQDARCPCSGHGQRREVGVAPVLRAMERAADSFRSANNFDRPAIANLVLLLDQFEAVLALPPAEQERFAALLNGLAVSGHVVLVVTLRSDRYDAFCRVSGFLDLKTAGLMIDVPMPGLAEIGDIVRKPAEAAGLAYEGDARTGEGLDDRLIAAAAGRDALPLLQFTLEKLFEAMVARLSDRGAGLASASRQDLVLRWEDYNTLGGLEGAIGLVADQAYRALDTDAQATLPRLIRVLVQGAEQSLVSEAAVRDDITRDEAMARLVRALEERRILVAGSRTAGDGTPHATVRFAHEAVLRGWPVLRNLIASNENFFRIREEIVTAERRWQDAGAPDDRLIPAGLPLVEAQSLVQDFGAELPKAIVAYVTASAEKDTNGEIANCVRRSNLPTPGCRWRGERASA